MPSRAAPAVLVFVNGQLRTDIHPIASQVTAGGERLDYAVLQRDLSIGQSHLVDLALVDGTDTEVVIVGPGGFTYAWGKLARQKITVGEQSEAVEYLARVEPFHFGYPVFGHWIYNPQPARFRQCDLPVVFNPIIDGKTEGNMRESDEHPNLQINVFLNPEAVRTNEAETEQASATKLWTLARAVRYLCNTCNQEQLYITNPTLAELEDVFSDERDIIRNIVIPDGTYLPQALDLLIKPFGYLWYIDYQDGRQIKFFKRGIAANQVSAMMQRPGEYLDRALSDTPAFSIDFDISEMYNQILGLGAFVEIEATWELKRAWPEDDDSKADTPDVLNRTDPDFGDVKDVWRKWVLNEAGDYNGLRPEFTHSHDFSDLADEWTGEDFAPPRRRRFMPMLSMNLDKSPIGKVDGVSVQYWREQDEEWVDVIEECQILTRECGVYFTGKLPPEEIMREGENAAVRVTATIRFDTRLKYLAEKQDTSPNASVIQLDLDVSDRFQYRAVKQFNVLVDGGSTLATNDYEKLQYYCEQMRDTWDMAGVAGPVHLEGIDNFGYGIGQAITGIAGRQISFNAKAGNGEAYPQIIGITYDYQRQRMVLNIDQFRKDRVIDRRSAEDTAENRARKFNKRTHE